MFSENVVFFRQKNLQTCKAGLLCRWSWREQMQLMFAYRWANVWSWTLFWDQLFPLALDSKLQMHCLDHHDNCLVPHWKCLSITRPACQYFLSKQRTGRCFSRCDAINHNARGFTKYDFIPLVQLHRWPPSSWYYILPPIVIHQNLPGP